MELSKINLQEKTIALNGTVEDYWFENEYIGLKNTLFHRIYIPLKAFDSGLDYVQQPEETVVVIEWLELQLKDPKNLEKLLITSELFPAAEASIYIGSAHNNCVIKKLFFQKKNTNSYSITCELFVDFENEGVAQNEDFSFNGEVVFEESN